MLRGTRILSGEDVRTFNYIVNTLRQTLVGEGFEEIIVPSIWEKETFYDKVGPENQQMMWEFQDKGGRDCCLIPEVTGLIQEQWREEWSKTRNTWNIFYVARCYRYERPQANRYREFTQFGMEMLGSKDTRKAKRILRRCIEQLAYKPFDGVCDYPFEITNFEFQLENGVKRGLSYYIEEGFEIIAPELGAQKQIAGGGPYSEGVGWAIGIDRLIPLLK